MINRDNWKLAQRYLDELDQVEQLDPKTIGAAHSHLRHLLEWLDDCPLAQAPTCKPPFPRYVAAGEYAPRTTEQIIRRARAFIRWAALADKKLAAKLTGKYISTLRTPRLPQGVNLHERFTVDEIRAICALEPSSLSEQRDQAAVAMLFLTGMRPGAFCSIPIKAFDPRALEVRLWPELGVKTKFKKASTVYMLKSLPDILAAALRWDDLVRRALPDDGLWYAPMQPPGGDCIRYEVCAGSARYGNLRLGLRRLCELAGVAYKSPHKLRHGFAVYGLMMAKDPADMAAVSKNLGHADLTMTMRVYAILDQAEVKSRIGKLGV